MGNSQSEGYAEAVQEGTASLRAAVSANLTGNHYPPIPQGYVEPVLEAIAAVNAGHLYQDIDIEAIRATGVVPRLADETGERLTITAIDLIQITHSWPFCDDHDDD